MHSTPQARPTSPARSTRAGARSLDATTTAARPAALWSAPPYSACLADNDARRIDLVVFYKIDRLTRALTDFVRLVERFDAAPSCP